jgi:uroporphyrinogen decarboxylase
LKERIISSGKSLAKIFSRLAHGNLPPPKLFPVQMLDVAASFSGLRGRVMPLTSLERLIVAMRHKEPDIVPCSPVIISGSRRLTGISLAEFAQNPASAAQALTGAFDLIGGDFIIPMLDLSVEAADFGQKLIYPAESTPYPDYSDPLIKDHTGYRSLKRIELRDAQRMNNILEMCRILVEEIGWRGVVTGFCFGPLGILCMMRGAEMLFKDCLLHKKDVMAALDTITSVLVEYVEAKCDTGVLAVVLDTLFASHNGLNRGLWEEIEGPFVRELAEAIHSKGCFVGVHNCGDGPYFDSQIRFMKPEIISFAHLPDNCSDNKELKQRYGETVMLMGYVDTTLIATSTPYEVMEACRRLIDDLAVGGGFILAPGCEYPPGIPLENAWAIVKAASLYGRPRG